MEVKTRNKNERQLAEYPHAELKLSKAEALLKYKKQIPDSFLFYAVILNDTDFYIFDLMAIDYSKINIVDWNIKKTQFNPNSPKEMYKIFQIPWNFAIKHARIKQTQEEKEIPSLF